MTAAGWENPKAPYDFTQGMWNDYNKNYSHLSWEEYMQMTKWGIKEIVDSRTYTNESSKGVIKYAKAGFNAVKDGVQQLAGKKGSKSQEQENTKKRLAAWFAMTFYNTDEMKRTTFDKLTNLAIQYSSLSYVAFNAIGNLNNLAIASANNSIEALGQRFFSRKSARHTVANV